MGERGDIIVIKGVIIVPLKKIVDERGKVMHMLRCDSPLFKEFGEIYFSVINPGAVKAWKRHLKMTQHFAVPVGEIRLVIYDNRSDSESRRIVCLSAMLPEGESLDEMVRWIRNGNDGE